ncbi:hypothetical protein V6N13_145214 [Hibiscus sabdariffa]|uniref:HhH-GPD base excision DNA repair family protein n=1 Tax=Hibiscus sabdariffa TaxID=183260 RepID=A0ABR2FN60_9ROSI
MASLYCNDQERDACFTNARYGRSRSKAQACLEKILHLISTVPPPCENNSNPFKKRGFDIDLNLRLGSFLDDGDGEESEEKSDCLAESSFIEGKTDTATATDASSDVTDIQKIEEFKSGTDGEVKTAAAFNDSLDLLIEAAEMLAYRDYYMNGKEKVKEKEVEEVEKSGGGGSMERDKDSSVNVEEEWLDRAAAVVRSKRGRSQVLPLRYRDSVLEPWMKRPQRSTAAAVVSKKKRKPR